MTNEKKVNPKLQAILDKKKQAAQTETVEAVKPSKAEILAQLKARKNGGSKPQTEGNILDDDHTIAKTPEKEVKKTVITVNPPKSNVPVQMNHKEKSAPTGDPKEPITRAMFEYLKSDLNQRIESIYSSINAKLSKEGLMISEKDEWCEVEYGDKLDIKKIQELANDGWRYAFPMQHKNKEGRMEYTKMFFFRPVIKTVKIKNNNH